MTGSAAVTNFGNINAVNYAIFGTNTATVTNNAGASIAGGLGGIVGNTGFANVTNAGSITGGTAIYGNTNAVVTNQTGGTITGTIDGIVAGIGAIVTNDFGGSIAGSNYGIRALGGNSSITNAGAISGTLTAIQFDGGGNTLTLAPTSVITGNVLGFGADTFQLGGTGTGTFNIASLSNAAQYKGFATFNKVGNSLWTLTGTSTFAGPVNVNAGTLSVNGNITSAGGVTVNAGGTLGGNGTVGNTTINGGALAPGNSIGLLTVQGNLGFTAASSYVVEVSPTNADRTNVTGTATLGGATVNARVRPRQLCRQAVHHPQRSHRRERHVRQRGQHQPAVQLRLEPEL